MNRNPHAAILTESTAFIFDLNGTMIDDMAFHNRAWHRILTEDLGAKISMEEVKKQMYGKNEELLVRVFGEGKFSEEEMNRISMKKERIYQDEFRPHLRLISGLERFILAAHAHGIPMAVGSAAVMFNIDYILDHTGIRQYFPVTVSADDVSISKPDPETFLKAARLMNVRPEDCIVFEDSPKGVEAANRAGMRSVVITTMHREDEFDTNKGITGFISDYTGPFITQLFDGLAKLSQ
jgi:beta-phosphoglucomutase family hydrolase